VPILPNFGLSYRESLGYFSKSDQT